MMDWQQDVETAQEFVDGLIDAYKTTWKDYEIDYNYFIRTTDTAHVKVVQQWLQDLIDKGEIYKSAYKRLGGILYQILQTPLLQQFTIANQYNFITKKCSFAHIMGYKQNGFI